MLIGPAAFENHESPDLPDGKQINKRLSLYTKAMAEAAQQNGVAFVDMFTVTEPLFRIARREDDKSQRLFFTINGVHLTEQGNHTAAKLIDDSLFGVAPKRDEKAMDALEKLRQAVIDKDFYWFNRYRVMDGYNVYGGRAFEKYAEKQSNYEDQQRELEILDVKTSNRDKRVWAIAQGGDLKVDDSNCPPLIPVKTNKPGNGPNGEFIFLDGEAAIQTDDPCQGNEGDSVRFREGISRIGQAGADAVRRQGPACGWPSGRVTRTGNRPRNPTTRS